MITGDPFSIAHIGTGGYSDNFARDWDERYRLTCADNGSRVIEYGYDVLDRRISSIKMALPPILYTTVRVRPSKFQFLYSLRSD